MFGRRNRQAPEGNRRPTARKAGRAEIERRLRDMTRKEEEIRKRIYVLEASIAAAPARRSRRKLRDWNTVLPDDPPVAPRERMKATRWQEQRLNRARSRQALVAAFLVVLLVLFFLWFQYQLRTHGVL